MLIMKTLLLLNLLVLLLLVTMMTCSASASTIVVPAGNVSDIITALASAPVDAVIQLEAGTYRNCTVPIYVNRPVSIQGTVIDCENNSTIVFAFVLGGSASISSLSIINASTAIAYGSSGVLTIEDVNISSCSNTAVLMAQESSRQPLSTIAIFNCNISYNTGHGILFDGIGYMSVNVTNSVISYNGGMTNDGGAIHVKGPYASLFVESSTISHSRTFRQGGCMFIEDGAHATITNSDISYCEAEIGGGIALTSPSSVYMYSSTMSNNKGKEGISYRTGGGSIFADMGTNVTVIKTIFADNYGPSGAGIAAYGCILNIAQCVFRNNTAKYCSGLQISETTVATLTDVDITNSIDTYDGTLCVMQSTATLYNVSVVYNKAMYDSVNMIESTVEWTRGAVTGNTVEIDPRPLASIVQISKTSLTMKDVVMTKNSGIYVLSALDTSHVLMTNCNVSRNNAGLRIESSSYIGDMMTITDNTPLYTVYECTDSSVHINRSYIYNNSASVMRLTRANVNVTATTALYNKRGAECMTTSSLRLMNESVMCSNIEYDSRDGCRAYTEYESFYCTGALSISNSMPKSFYIGDVLTIDVPIGLILSSFSGVKASVWLQSEGHLDIRIPSRTTPGVGPIILTLSNWTTIGTSLPYTFFSNVRDCSGSMTSLVSPRAALSGTRPELSFSIALSNPSSMPFIGRCVMSRDTSQLYSDYFVVRDNPIRCVPPPLDDGDYSVSLELNDNGYIDAISTFVMYTRPVINNLRLVLDNDIMVATICGTNIRASNWTVPSCIFNNALTSPSEIHDNCMKCQFLTDDMCDVNTVAISLYSNDWSTNYAFIPQELLGCPVTIYSAWPPALPINRHSIMTFHVKKSCACDLKPQCYFGDVIGTFLSDKNDTVMCDIPMNDAPRTVPLELGFSIGHLVYNATHASPLPWPLTLQYYLPPVLTPASPQLGHEGLTRLSVSYSGFLMYNWTKLRCVFDDVTSSAAAIDNDSNTLECMFNVNTPCSSLHASRMYLSLFNDSSQEIPCGDVINVCTPTPFTMEYAPNSVLISVAMTKQNITIKSKTDDVWPVDKDVVCNFYGSQSVSTTGYIKNSTIITCRLPEYSAEETVHLLMSFDGQTFYAVGDIQFYRSQPEQPSSLIVPIVAVVVTISTFIAVIFFQAKSAQRRRIPEAMTVSLLRETPQV